MADVCFYRRELNIFLSEFCNKFSLPFVLFDIYNKYNKKQIASYENCVKFKGQINISYLYVGRITDVVFKINKKS